MTPVCQNKLKNAEITALGLKKERGINGQKTKGNKVGWVTGIRT
jgi:hypothetical protein